MKIVKSLLILCLCLTFLFEMAIADDTVEVLVPLSADFFSSLSFSNSINDVPLSDGTTVNLKLKYFPYDNRTYGSFPLALRTLIEKCVSTLSKVTGLETQTIYEYPMIYSKIKPYVDSFCDAYFQLCIIVPSEETEVYSFFVDAQTGEFLIKPLVYCIGS